MEYMHDLSMTVNIVEQNLNQGTLACSYAMVSCSLECKNTNDDTAK